MYVLKSKHYKYATVIFQSYQLPYEISASKHLIAIFLVTLFLFAKYSSIKLTPKNIHQVFTL